MARFYSFRSKAGFVGRCGRGYPKIGHPFCSPSDDSPIFWAASCSFITLLVPLRSVIPVQMGLDTPLCRFFGAFRHLLFGLYGVCGSQAIVITDLFSRVSDGGPFRHGIATLR